MCRKLLVHTEECNAYEEILCTKHRVEFISHCDLKMLKLFPNLVQQLPWKDAIWRSRNLKKKNVLYLCIFHSYLAPKKQKSLYPNYVQGI